MEILVLSPDDLRKLKQREYNKRWRETHKEQFKTIQNIFYEKNIKSNEEYKKYFNERCRKYNEKKIRKN